jgi:hypothetical protein
MTVLWEDAAHVFLDEAAIPLFSTWIAILDMVVVVRSL